MRSVLYYPCILVITVLLAVVERSSSQFQLQNLKKPFYVNCDEQNITDVVECKNHIRTTLEMFVESNDYSPNQLPVTLDYSLPLDVQTWMTFASIDDVSVKEGTLGLSIYLDMIWYDQFLTWNSTVCLGVENVNVDHSLVFVPDFYLYNVVGEFDEMISEGRVDWHASGAMWYSRVGGMTFACDYNLKDFPADTQKCTMKFGSLLYYADLMTFSPPSPFMVDDGPTNLTSIVLQESFQSSAWNVKKVTGDSVIEVIYDTEYSFMHWSVTIKRYPSYYLATSIIPESIVVIIAILSFWVDDLVARLVLSITALLIVMAIQDTVNKTLPVSRVFTWMSEFSITCIILVALCVAQTCAIAYMRDKTGLVPNWVQFMISLSHNCRKIYRIITCHKGAGAITVKRRNTQAIIIHQENKFKLNSPKHAQIHPISGDTPLKSLPQRAQEIESTNLNNEVNNAEGGEDDEEVGLIGAQSLKVREISNLDELVPLFKCNHWNSGNKAIEISWRHGAESLDDCASVLFPVVFFIVLVVMVFANDNLMEGV